MQFSLKFAHRLADRLFGYDFFISYAHADERRYPKKLAQKLTGLGFKIFLDEEDYTPGIALKSATVRRVKMSRHLIVIAGPAALKSHWVRQEVAAHHTAGRVPLVINMNKAVEQALDDSALARTIFDNHWLWIDEHQPVATAEPSTETVDGIARAFKSMRQDRKRALVLALLTLLTVLIVSVSGYSFLKSRLESQGAARQTTHALTARAQRALNERQFEQAAVLALAASAIGLIPTFGTHDFWLG